MRNIDYLIVGQGIAGSSLAYCLMQQGKSVVVMDNPRQLSASAVAAGLMQGVSGKFLTRNEFLMKCYDITLPLFKNMESVFETSLLTEMDTYRFAEEIQLKKFEKKRRNPDYEGCFHPELVDCTLPNITIPNCIKVLKSHVVQTSRFLDLFRNYFKDHNALVETYVSPRALTLQPDSVTYDDIHAKKIIFCTGGLATKLPFFKHLPLRTIKGETILFSTPDLPQDRILQRRLWVVPYGNQVFKMGGNYDPTQACLPTQKTLDIFTAFMAECGVSQYEVIHQMSGFRCFLEDQFPICGFLPEQPQIGLFCGFGSKGFITAPAMAALWAEDIEHGSKLPSDVLMSRIKAASPSSASV